MAALGLSPAAETPLAWATAAQDLLMIEMAEDVLQEVCSLGCALPLLPGPPPVPAELACRPSQLPAAVECSSKQRPHAG